MLVVFFQLNHLSLCLAYWLMTNFYKFYQSNEYCFILYTNKKVNSRFYSQHSLINYVIILIILIAFWLHKVQTRAFVRLLVCVQYFDMCKIISCIIIFFSSS